jgi:hypothetical protein
MRIRCPFPLSRDNDTSDDCGEPMRVTVAPGSRAGWSAPAEPAEITGVSGSCPHVVAFNRGDLDDARLWDALDEKAKDEGGEA